MCHPDKYKPVIIQWIYILYTSGTFIWFSYSLKGKVSRYKNKYFSEPVTDQNYIANLSQNVYLKSWRTYAPVLFVRDMRLGCTI